MGFDGSEHSERALTLAAEMAAQLQASLHVVRVEALPQLPAAGDELDAAEMEELAQRFNEEVLRTRNESVAVIERVVADRVEANLHVISGSPADALLAAINTWNPDLVVVGSHGHGALKRLLLGSVSTQLCRRSPVPVVVVPPLRQVQEEGAALRAPAAEDSAAAVPVQRLARSCMDCGHILNEYVEPPTRCVRCGRESARRFSTPLCQGPVDVLEPAVGESMAESLPVQQTNAPAGLFSTAPAGASGYDVNPDLRVRY